MDQPELVDGRYRIDSVISETELGILWRARHVQLDDLVIVKVLSESVRDPRLAAKFVREARNAARIKSERVARFIDAGILPDGRSFIVMENLDGATLECVLARGETISDVDAVDWMVQTCEALAAAHAVGIVHRELSTGCIFVVSDPAAGKSVKLTGFGAPRTADSSGREEDTALTVATLTQRAPAYAAPEALAGRVADARADVWSVGVILYELLSRHRPFAGSPDELLKAMLTSTPPPPRTQRPGLDQVIARCLRPNPAARYQDVGALAAALAPFGSSAAEVTAARVARIVEPRLPNLSTILDFPREDSESQRFHRFVDGAVEGVYDGRLHERRSQPRSRLPLVLVVVCGLGAIAGSAFAIRGRWARGTSASSREAPKMMVATEPTPISVSSDAAACATPAVIPDPPAALSASSRRPETLTHTVPASRSRQGATRSDGSRAVGAPSRGGNDDPWGWKR